MERQLFGTDGIRGVAGEYPLDAATVYATGAALGGWSACHAESPAAPEAPAGPEVLIGPAGPEVLIGMDTRESGEWLAGLIAAGLASQGVRARFAGLITTPGVAYLTRTGPFVAGVMISASHNPYQDNGIKVFSHSGYKLPDEEEHKIEASIFRLRETVQAPQPAALVVEEKLDGDYLDYLASTCAYSLDGLHMVVDCGHGAATHLAPALFRQLGARVETIGCEPNGRNINLERGATHMDALRKEVTSRRAGLGIAFDGDADRAMFVSSGGDVVNGDNILLICGRHMHAKGLLPVHNGRPVVVATVMSNLGLEVALDAAGIGMVRTPVGDKYVLEEMLRLGAVLGGEQSGHVIFTRHATTGDGLLTALRVLEVLRESGASLDELAGQLKVFPQLLLNVRVQRKKPLDSMPSVREQIRSVEDELSGRGRVVVRFSGTEPLARVMVEAPDEPTVRSAAERIAGAIRAELGG